MNCLKGGKRLIYCLIKFLFPTRNLFFYQAGTMCCSRGTDKEKIRKETVARLIVHDHVIIKKELRYARVVFYKMFENS